MKKFAVGIDLGGTKMQIAIVDDNGHVVSALNVPTESALGTDHVIEKILSTVQRIISENGSYTISAIGLGIAGQVDRLTGSVIYAPNLGWHNIPLKDLFIKKFNISVSVCNDVRAAAWAEWRVGAVLDCSNFVCMFIGTGIGGAIVSNDALLEGKNNTAGEIGHMILKKDGPECHCGNAGCFEALAGGWAIQRDAQIAILNDKLGGKMLLELAGGNINLITAKHVVEAAKAGDRMATMLVDNVVDVVVLAIASIINVLGPEKIVLGGGIVEGMPDLVGRIAAGVAGKALKAAVSSVSIVPSSLHGVAGTIGSALIALYGTEMAQMKR